jgi:phage gp46-like protein
VTDVRLYQTPDGGEIDFANGLAIMADGVESSVYLSLFGGNENDGGGDADASKQFWGNLSESDPARRYRSETQALLRSIPLVPANLQRIQDAAVRDLAWLKDSKLSDSVTVRATIPALNSLKLEVRVEIDGKLYPFSFVESGKKST